MLAIDQDSSGPDKALWLVKWSVIQETFERPLSRVTGTCVQGGVKNNISTVHHKLCVFTLKEANLGDDHICVINAQYF